MERPRKLCPGLISLCRRFTSVLGRSHLASTKRPRHFNTKMLVQLVLFLIFIKILHINSGRMRETAYLYDFSPCPGVEMASEVNTSFNYRGSDDYRINVDWKLNGTVDNLSAILDIKKCPTRALVDCEVYLRFPVDEICHAVRNELNYTRLLQNAQPPIKSCPLKGRYQLKDFPIVNEIPDVKKLLGFGFITDNKVLKCDFSLLTGSDVLLCVRMVGSFRLTRNNLEIDK